MSARGAPPGRVPSRGGGPVSESEVGDGWIEVHRTRRRRESRHRALVLESLGIPHALVQEAGLLVLRVPETHGARAAAELERYERENAGWPRRHELPRAAPGVFPSIVLYGAVLVLVHLLDRGAALGRAWTEAGYASAAAIRAGSWWRALTALELHTGPVHLANNVVSGMFFGGFVAYALGGGLGWLAVLAAGFAGNLANAWIQSPEHGSVGASTAVFGAIGILVGSELRRRHLLRDDAVRRFGPLVGGLILLGYLGVSGERTDVLAHVTGLAAGIPIGALVAGAPRRAVENRGLQLLFGALALALATVAGAWALALRA